MPLRGSCQLASWRSTAPGIPQQQTTCSTHQHMHMYIQSPPLHSATSASCALTSSATPPFHTQRDIHSVHQIPPHPPSCTASQAHTQLLMQQAPSRAPRPHAQRTIAPTSLQRCQALYRSSPTDTPPQFSTAPFTAVQHAPTRVRVSHPRFTGSRRCPAAGCHLPGAEAQPPQPPAECQH